MRLTLFSFLFFACMTAREFNIRETLAQIEEMISTETKGAYFSFSESDFRIATGLEGDFWDQFEMSELLSLNEPHILKAKQLPYTALKGHSPQDMWASSVFNRVKSSWNQEYFPIFSALFSTGCRNECTHFFRFLRTQNVLIISRSIPPEPTKNLLFGESADWVSTENAGQICPEKYTVIIWITKPIEKSLALKLLSQNVFILDCSSLDHAIFDWSLETWKKWVQKHEIKFLYTSALIPYKFEERKAEYIKTLKQLEEFGYKNKVYIVESGPYCKESFFENFSPNVFYANTNDTTFINKGVNEGKASLAAFNYYNFDDEDMIIKLTGRYFFNSDQFIRMVEEHPEVDAYASPVPNWGVITGCFALRSKYYKRFLNGIDFDQMEKNLIDIEKKTSEFLKIIETEGANVVYLDKIGITANVANVEVQQW